MTLLKITSLRSATRNLRAIYEIPVQEISGRLPSSGGACFSGSIAKSLLPKTKVLTGITKCKALDVTRTRIVQPNEVRYLKKPPESVENYLETILMLSHNDGPVRSVDIANELEYSKPSISVAMKNLRASGYIIMDTNGHISLTESGREIAQKIYDRHMLISDWLIFLGVDKKIAASDACKMEHGMSEESYIAIQKHIEEWKHSAHQNLSS